MKLDDFEAALESFSKAFDLAHAQGDRAAEAAIRKAIQDVKASIVLKQSQSECLYIVYIHCMFFVLHISSFSIFSVVLVFIFARPCTVQNFSSCFMYIFTATASMHVI